MIEIKIKSKCALKVKMSYIRDEFGFRETNKDGHKLVNRGLLKSVQLSAYR